MQGVKAVSVTRRCSQCLSSTTQDDLLTLCMLVCMLFCYLWAARCEIRLRMHPMEAGEAVLRVPRVPQIEDNELQSVL